MFDSRCAPMALCSLILQTEIEQIQSTGETICPCTRPHIQNPSTKMAREMKEDYANYCSELKLIDTNAVEKLSFQQRVKSSRIVRLV